MKRGRILFTVVTVISMVMASALAVAQHQSQQGTYTGGVQDCKGIGQCNQSNQAQQQNQGQQQGQVANGGNATAAGGNASNGGQQNSQVTEFNQVHQAPDAFAPNVYPTSPCVVGGSGGGSWLTGGFGLGITKTNKDCDARELGRLFLAARNYKAFAKILCGTKAAKRAKLTMDDCLANTPEAPVQQIVQAAPATAPQIVVPPAQVTINPVVEHTITQAAPAVAPTKPVHKRPTKKPCHCEK